MYKRDNLTWTKHYDFIFLDAAVLFLSFVFAYFLYNHRFSFYSSNYYRVIAALFMLLDILVAVLFNTMHNVMHRGYWQEFAQTVKQVLLVQAFLLLVLFLMKLTGTYSRITLSLTAIFHTLFGYLSRLAWKHSVRRRGTRAEKRSMLLVCSEEDVPRVLERSREEDEAKFTGLVMLDRDAEGETVSGLPVVANLADAAMYVCREWVDEVFIFPDSIADLERSIKRNPEAASILSDNYAEYTRREREGDFEAEAPSSPKPEEEITPLALFLDRCRLMAVPVHIRVPLGGVAGDNSFIEKVNGFNVITSSINVASPIQLFLKRCMDIIGGLIGSLFALLILAIVGPKIKKASPGPLIYTQERIGQNGKHFKIFKIRSMYLDADERKKEFMAQNRVSDGMMFKLDFDPRIIGNEILPDGTKKTGIGEFIRSHSLDEFPQFWNVLRGEMSIVGTRPPTLDEWEKYQYHHRARLAFRPGVTGMWQVSGRSNITDFEEVVRLDTDYIEHWSIGLDLRLILKTVTNMFTGNGAM